MENTKIALDMGSIARAFVDPGALGRMLINPIKEKGLMGGIGHYLGSSFIPRTYRTGLLEEVTSKRDQLAKLLGSKSIKGVNVDTISNNLSSMGSNWENSFRKQVMDAAQRVTPSEAGIPSELINKIRTANPQELIGYAKQYLPNTKIPRFNPDNISSMRNVVNEIKRQETLANKLEKSLPLTTEEKMRQGGHYLNQAINTGLVAGLPLMSLYHAMGAPEGERGKAALGTLGNTAGFLLGAPLGILPAMAGSMLGQSSGESLSNKLSPPSTYRKMMNYFSPEQREQFKQGLPYVMRNVIAPMTQHLKALPYGAMDMASNTAMNIPMAGNTNIG